MDLNKSRPISSGYLAVGHGHEIYYETCGNTEGIPVLFLHGGPGLGCSDRDKRFFDLEVFYLILMDQRGAGRSKPAGGLAHNNTQLLIGDIDRLLDHLALPQVMLFGGSWGSTLAMLYTIHNPNRVTSMVLRGFFPANRACADFMEQGGVATFFPEAWERYSRMVPAPKRSRTAAYYLKMMQSPDPSVRERFAYEMAYYATSLSRRTIAAESIHAMITAMPFESKMRIQTFYSVHDFFIEENFIYANLSRVGKRPVRIIHGRYDMVCPPVYAYRLHRGLENSKLYMVDAGHASSEVEIEAGLKIALDEMIALLR